jgi:hypothetical protein
MAISSLSSISLTGTLPVRPFGDHLYGTIEADGQEPKVTALACTPGGEIIILSLVGYDTSVAAALARLHAGKGLLFCPNNEVAWEGPHQLLRLPAPYRQFSTALAGTRERHYVSLSRLADIGFGLLHPPTIPDTMQLEATNLPEGAGAAPPLPKDPPAPRYVLGNADEATPERASFLGHLRALRVIHLSDWADALWAAGLEHHLIQPLPALGIRCWRLEGDLQRWSALLTDGVRHGWFRAPHA